MQRRTGLRPARAGAGIPAPPPVIPQVPRGRGRGRGGRGGRWIAQQPPIVAPVLLQQVPCGGVLPPIVQQQVVQPPGPLPPNLPAIVPP
jgi:hypothetical protein